MKIKHRLILTLGFLVGSPLITFLLLWVRGLPDFAQGHLDQVLIWVFSVVWIPALFSGALLSALLAFIVAHTPYFHKPYDIGRSISLGAVLGAVLQALTTLGYRALTHHPFSDFWIGGAMIAGCLTGALMVPFILKQISKAPQATPKTPPANTLFAQRVFKWSGIYGLVALMPHYLLEQRIGIDTPPPITHPEYFYGFVGVGVAWQFLFLVIARDPVRYRAAMPAGMLEKLLFGVAALVLYGQGRVYPPTAFFACLDLCLAVLFAAAYNRTPRT